jgi:DNA repair protein RecN (Recombination protein N)
MLEPTHQLDLLDRFAAVEELRDRVGDLVTKHRAARDELEHGRAAERDRAQREDLIRFQVGELDAARIRSGEEEDLRAELRRLRNVERLGTGLGEVSALLAEDAQAVTARLARAVHVLHGLARLDAAFAGPAEPLAAAAAHVDEAITAVRALREDLVAEPGRLEAIDERLDLLTRLKRKYGDTEEAMLAFRAAAASELERLQRHEELLTEQERLVKEFAAELAGVAAQLSERRAAAGRRLALATERQLRTLGMERAEFEIHVERAALEHVSPRGLDRIEFRLSANPGEEPRALSRIASGGELSRTMLAIQNVLAAADPVGTMIFDEVDAGIGARVASVVAERLAAVAEARQVLCVTHLAPIAARARRHLRVTKAVRGGRTRVSAATLSATERVEEIARMLGGDAGSATALRHARELLGRS